MSIIKAAGSGPEGRRAFEKMALRYMFSTFLLWYISKNRTYGYELIKRLDAEEKFRVVSASQMYPMLKSLTKQGLVSVEREMQGRRARKVYRITAAGRAALAKAKKCICVSPLKREFLKEMVL